MANAAEIAVFIEMIAPHAQKAFKTLGKVRPSVCIGMACVESAFGTSQIMRAHNAFFGQKVGSGKTATKYWQGAFFTSKTKEEYTVGTHTIINAAFRAYPNVEMCVFNYYELLNTKLYDRVQAGASYKQQMAQIKACGYMTSSTEVNSVISIIERYNLTKYDFDGVPATPAKNPYKLVMNQGTQGECVKWLQYELNRHGAGLTIDGKYGGATFASVLQFQKTHALLADGIAGSNTINTLKKLMS